ncbi:TetR/AcrR family transcriptional regulator [Spongiibacter sp. KMU-158]|uniref:TetR/AcrR family transcriptional regulator n=1 Tax=Spongiibacter pelagi TaxID=2760804 RepID=A0A927GVS7_9GAMM|nr:TetR/AcrR family transcriptional regulator [Spongiibacter pelagi]MBD2857689.1 TetR/AcrR family transcriptional regulator [Spongiibacter pelagi]
MKTRDKILLTSLNLFNSEGEPNVTTVDIANELDISPGNLYYHFHGKEQIITELYKGFELEFTEILEAPLDKVLNPQDSWFYLYIVFEQVFNHRYFYHNLNDILQRYPDIKKRFLKLLELKRDAARAIADQLIEAEILEISEGGVEHLCDNVALNLTFWLNYNQLRQQEASNEVLIHQGVFQLMSLVAPYLAEDFRYFYEESRALFEALTKSE